MAEIHLEVCRIDALVQLDAGMERKAFIQMQKQAIAQHRNQLLSAYLAADIQDSSFAKTAFGKPYLKDHPQFYFNHSHSQQHYVLAHSQRTADLGVDIEDLDRKVRFEALAKHAFHVQELETWLAAGCDPEYWFKVWTVKEAVLKASGLGIRINLNELNTRVYPDVNGGMCSHPAIGVFAYQNYTLPHAMLSVAWRADQSCKGFQLPRIQLYQH
ncbi:4'-phosphopantetheinyl transferase family protein [Acinetobacter tianfuensis]|uniref:4'-phosphopantetheinyl transferase superfamily protein n=1 Tax=Acinetobacter tianfuensis TaxID=2419603 RepID=A0A3A8EGK9_9GAMM|nr:4'-phosphopantetheinyl transferase superfamily protein [Acinetobacter tianfuensis]RKG33258.1 4'-phosphopantetheinyl transferase superfamily protein [Acinetobacter tianfuensis]